MVAAILNSPRAVEVSVFVVRTFVKLRQLAPPPDAKPNRRIGFGREQKQDASP